MQYDGIIFDLDGTLWDASKTVLACWETSVKEICPGKEAPTAADVANCMGYTTGQIAEYYRYKYGEYSPAVVKCCLEKEPGFLEEHGAYIYPGVAEMVYELSKRYKLCIVSNCICNYIEAFLHVSGLEKYFADHECEGRTGMLKEDNIKLIAERNGFSNPLYVGDTVIDMQAAENAGCDFVFAEYGFGKVENAKNRIKKPYELAEML